MRFIFAAVLALSSVAGADRLGVFLPGLYYQQDSGWRYSLGPVFAGGGGRLALDLSAAVSYLMPAGQTPGAEAYYGFGLGLGLPLLSLGNGGGGVSLYPNVVAGLNVQTGSRFTPFFEASLGPSIRFGGAGHGGVGLGIGFTSRLGVDCDLR